MDFQHLSMTRCHLPMQIHHGFGTASSSRLEVDWLQLRLELHITFRTRIIVLTATTLGGTKPCDQVPDSQEGVTADPQGLAGALALSNACYSRLPNTDFY